MKSLDSPSSKSMLRMKEMDLKASSDNLMGLAILKVTKVTKASHRRAVSSEREMALAIPKKVVQSPRKEPFSENSTGLGTQVKLARKRLAST